MAAAADDVGDDVEDDFVGLEDDVYQEAKAASNSRKRRREERARGPAVHPPLADPEASGKRGITREIEKNRGLTPHRSKERKNPRKKHRLRYGKAVVRRKGQVQDVASRPDSYGGEATGVRSKLARSRRL